MTSGEIALIGNPNCGKTSLFNQLTGSHQTVGNWPGVTVERTCGTVILPDRVLTLVDLPGLYSLGEGGAEVEAVVFAEPGVLSRDQGARQGRGDLVDPAPAMVQATALHRPDHHQRRHRRRDEPIENHRHHRPSHQNDEQSQRDIPQKPPHLMFPRSPTCLYPTDGC